MFNVSFDKITETEKNGRTTYFDSPVSKLEVPGLAEKRPSVLYRDIM